MRKLVRPSTTAVLVLLGATSLASAQIAAHDRGIKPEQAGAERSYEARTQARIRELIHADRHLVTEEERQAVDDHWRRTARIWRIRHLAEDAKDTTTVTRCDSLLARADKILEAQLKKLADKAPVKLGGSR